MPRVALRETRGPKDGLVCVATTDHCVRVLYADTFKFKVSPRPAAAVSVSAGRRTGKLLTAQINLEALGPRVRGPATVDLAHDDAVTGLQWLRGTHYCITTSKDGSVKQWDCDRLETPFVQLFREATRRKCGASRRTRTGARSTRGADRALRCWRDREPVFGVGRTRCNSMPLRQIGRWIGRGRAARRTGHIIPRRRRRAQRGAERIAEALELAQGEAAVRATALEKGTRRRRRLLYY